MEMDTKTWRLINNPPCQMGIMTKENMNSCVKDALETIKRVLSLGALDEQEQSEHPNKRFCFLTTSSYKENSVRDDQMC